MVIKTSIGKRSERTANCSTFCCRLTPVQMQLARTIADDKDSSVPIVTLSYFKEHECSSKQHVAMYR